MAKHPRRIQPKYTHKALAVAPSLCRYLGRSLGATVKVACHTCGGLKELDYTAFECKLHGRCLPAFNPRREAREMWDQRKPESDIYHLCGIGRCADFSQLVAIDLAAT